MPDRKRKDRPTWIRYSSVGVEFAAAVVGLVLAGLWVDHHFECQPWGLLTGAALGLIGGTYNLVRQSLSAFRDLESGKDEERRE